MTDTEPTKQDEAGRSVGEVGRSDQMRSTDSETAPNQLIDTARSTGPALVLTSELQRGPVLSALYQATYAEISRLRDQEWRITYYFILLSLGAAGFLLSSAVRPHIVFAIRVLLTGVAVLGQILGSYLLYRTHRWLTEQRNIRRRLERVMGFYDELSYDSQPLLPYGGQSVSLHFQLYDLVIPLATGMLMANAMVVYIVWSA